jgi:hypothetical protein
MSISKRSGLLLGSVFTRKIAFNTYAENAIGEIRCLEK